MDFQEERNAVISGTSLSTEDYGCLVAFLHLNYDKHASQSFGGHRLYTPKESDVDIAGFFICSVLEIVGVGKWEELRGKHIRVRTIGGMIVAIGNILEDEWFYPKREIEMLLKPAEKREEEACHEIH